MSYRKEVYFEAEADRELAFPREEFKTRLLRIRELMANEKIDCLFLTSPESMYYLSGFICMWYQTESPLEWPPSNGFAVHVDHDNYIHFETEREAFLTRTFCVDGDVRYFPDASYRDGVQFIVNELKTEGWLKSNIGLEHRAMRPNRAVSDRFQNCLEQTGVTVMDGSDIVRRIRWLKSPAEMICLEESARIATVGLKAAERHVSPGATELEVQGEITRSMTASGGEFQSMMMPVLSGRKSNATHGISTRKKISKNEPVLVDLSGVHKRYHVNAARTFFTGDPPPDVLEITAKAVGAMNAAIEHLKPNLSVREFNESVKKYYHDEDLWDRRGWIGGYEMGISFYSDWVGNFVYDPMSEKNADRYFEPNTAVNYEVQVFLPGHIGAFFLVETFLFYEDKVVCATKDAPYDMIQIN